MLEKFKTLQKLFADEKNWTKSSNARDIEGNSVWIFSDKACCFCLSGGMKHVYVSTEKIEELWVKLRNAIAVRDGIGNIIGFNDAPNTTIAEIRAVVAEANV